MKETRLNSLSDIRSKQQGTMDALIAKNQSIKSVKTQMLSVEGEITKLENDIRGLNDSLNVRNDKIKNIELENLGLQTNQDVAKEIGPLKYISKLTGKTLDQVVNYFIIALMLVFDPLAISLVIAANFIFTLLKSERTGVTHNQEDTESNVFGEEVTEEGVGEMAMSDGEEFDLFDVEEKDPFDGVEPSVIKQVEEPAIVEPEVVNPKKPKIHKPANPGIREIQIDPTRLK